MLLLLVTGQRGQFIHLLSLNGIQLTSQTTYLSLEEHTKTSRPNKATAAVEITEFTPDSSLCPLTTRKAYMQKTETLRNGENKLFISFIKPNKAVSRDNFQVDKAGFNKLWYRHKDFYLPQYKSCLSNKSSSK